MVCCLNNGRGGFTNVTAMAGTASRYGSFTMALADIDGNGTLDLYVGNYQTEDVRDVPRMDVFIFGAGKPVISRRFKDQIIPVNGKVYQIGQPNLLYLNDGQGHFTPVPWTDGRFLDEAGQPLPRPRWTGP